MSSKKVLLVSDANIDPLGRCLANSTESPPCSVASAPFGQVYQTFSAAVEKDQYDVAVVWTRPEGVIKSFGHARNFNDVNHDDVLHEVDQFSEQLLSFARRFQCVLVPSWTLPVPWRGYGMLDFRPGLGIASLIARMNLRLSENLSQNSAIFVVDAEQWVRAAGAEASPSKMWFAAKVPFGNSVFDQASKDIKAALRGVSGEARRLVILDLDDTLWGGTVGETGWAGLTLGGHDHVGEAFSAFQQTLKALTNRGIQLGIVSKNDEKAALSAIDNHPGMILRRSDFAGWRINWNDKAANVAALTRELKLGLESVVFIDDTPAERARVRESFAEVLVPEWPTDPALYAKALQSLACFDIAAISREDRQRASMYAAERERKATRAGSLDEWLTKLGIIVKAERLSTVQLPRTAQLFNKTNQMNMATRRLTEHELWAWADRPDRALWTFSVADRFGDSGLTGLISAEIINDSLHVIDFILSCRVMGRKVEETMLHVVDRFAREHNLQDIRAAHIPTERNGPCLEFWQRSGFQVSGDYSFIWSTDSAYPLPDVVTLIEAEAGERKDGLAIGANHA